MLEIVHYTDMVRLPSGPAVSIGLGVLLLANPLYVDALHLDQPNWYWYESGEVTVGDDGVRLPRGALNGMDDDVACLADSPPSRACAVEHAVLRRGNLTLAESWGALISNAGPLGYRYAYLNSSFYEPVVREEGDWTVLSLDRTPAVEALGDVADPVSRADRGVRRAIRSGSVRTHRELEGANQLWKEDGRYYVVYRTSFGNSGPFDFLGVGFGRALETAITVVGMVAGLVLVLRGQRRRVDAEWRETLRDDR